MPVELLHSSGPVAELVLSNPERLNAFTRADLADAIEVLDAAAAAPSVRSLLVRGAGRAFCAGADKDFLAGLAAADHPERTQDVRPGIDLVLRLVRFPRPVVAVVQGPAYGGGACLALACDHIVAADDAQLGLVFTSLGLPGGDMAATWLLARRVGTRRAWRLLCRAAVLDADAATAAGLVDTIATAGTELELARTEALELARGPVEALTATKRQVLALEGAFDDLDHVVCHQQAAIAAAIGGPEFAEGMAAQRSGRFPRFLPAGEDFDP